MPHHESPTIIRLLLSMCYCLFAAIICCLIAPIPIFCIFYSCKLIIYCGAGSSKSRCNGVIKHSKVCHSRSFIAILIAAMRFSSSHWGPGMLAFSYKLLAENTEWAGSASGTKRRTIRRIKHESSRRRRGDRTSEKCTSPALIHM